MYLPLCADDIIPITPSDSVLVTATIPANTQGGIYIATSGDITFETVAGTVRTITVANGAQLYVRVKRILATGTTASGISVFLRGV